MKTKLLFANIVIVVLLFSACTGGSKTSCIVDGGDTFEIRYATNLKIVRFSDYTVATVRNPWDTLKTLHTYVLVDKQKPVPEHLPEGKVVRVPVEKALVYSVVHGGLLDELGATKKRIVVLNKCDKLSSPIEIKNSQILLSTKTSVGIDKLLEAIKIMLED